VSSSDLETKSTRSAGPRHWSRSLSRVVPPVVIDRDGKQQGGIAPVHSIAPQRVSSRMPTHFPPTLSEFSTPVSVRTASSVTTRIPVHPCRPATFIPGYPARCAARLIRTSEAQQVPPRRTRPALLLLGVDIQHTFESRS
jgi:hypothetical protein